MNQRDSAAPWPAGGGQCEERTRTFAWAATELGASPAWPEHLRVLVDTLLRSPAPMVLLWGERGILLYNDACLRIAGARHPAAFGKPVAEGWPEIAGPNLGVIARVLQGESISLRDQQVMIKRNGTDEQAWFDLDFSPVLDDAGRPAGTLAVVAETTRRVTRDGALAARSEHEFSSLAEAAPLHVWAADAQGSLYWFNARVYQSTGAAPGSLDGVAWGRVVHPDDLAKAAETWANAVGAGVTYETEFRIWSEPDNDYKWYLVRAVPYTDEAGTVRWIGTNTDVQDKKLAAEQLASLNATLEQRVNERTAQRDRMWRLSQEIMLEADFDGNIIATNPAWGSLLGWSEDELRARRLFSFVHPDDYDITLRESERLASGLMTTMFVNRYRHKDGSYRSISWSAVPDGRFLHAVGRDITREQDAAAALRASEESLRQSQKMEAVGQLTGGIAHDFNNLLQGIVGSIEAVRKLVEVGRLGEIERFINSAMSSARRAAALTHRLLAFSRRQPLDPKPVKINKLVASMEDLLRRSLTPAVKMEMVLAAGLWTTLCDANQVENAILNLVINARDAMPDGGTVVIETGNAHLDRAYAGRTDDIAPGQYVCISVTDSGTGMSQDVIERAFDPFFTTKPIGQGTGLGLSMVYGFARQSDGYAKIYSEPGRGTTVKLYLPRYRGAELQEAAAETLPDLSARQDGKLILVIEDEDVVRELVLHILHELGYRTLEAADGPSGLRILQSGVAVDLLITDIGLPGLNGRQVADAARLIHPQLKILFMTGYAENAAVTNGMLEPDMEMITKPFAMDTMVRRVADMIDRGSRR